MLFLLSFTGLLVLVQPQMWVTQSPYDYIIPPYYYPQTFGFVLTENESQYTVNFMTTQVVVDSISTNATPISLYVLSDNVTYEAITGLTTISDQSLVIHSPSWVVGIVFAREEADASVNVTLWVSQTLTNTTAATTAVVIPIPLIGMAFGTCMIAFYRLMRIEKECRKMLVAQSRWGAHNGLVAVTALLLLTSFMVTPHVANSLGNAYREYPRTLIDEDDITLQLDASDPILRVNLTAIREERTVQDITVSSFYSSAEVRVDLLQNERLLLRFHTSRGLNQSYIDPGTQGSEIVIQRVSEDSDVYISLRLESNIYVTLIDPLLYVILTVLALVPFSAAVVILRSVQLRLRNGPYESTSQDESVSSGLELV